MFQSEMCVTELAMVLSTSYYFMTSPEIVTYSRLSDDGDISKCSLILYIYTLWVRNRVRKIRRYAMIMYRFTESIDLERYLTS